MGVLETPGATATFAPALVAPLLAGAGEDDDHHAVMCVHHDYTPKEATKVDGAVQTVYPRKNWSSMVLFNCGHPRNVSAVSTRSGAFLHRFMWLDDGEVGEVPFVWNFLVGHNAVDPDDEAGTAPRALHSTSGGPWFERYKDCEFAYLWIQERDAYLAEEEEDVKAVPMATVVSVGPPALRA
nr:unnamed protein product [Digitaria exilis]